MLIQERYQQIVERFEAVARANLGKPGGIAEFCEAAGVTPRTLSRACHTVRGTTPVRHLRAIRLAAARQALMSADARAETITEVAMRFGFRELGRFAVSYRTEFGESPSQTLSRARSSLGLSREAVLGRLRDLP